MERRESEREKSKPFVKVSGNNETSFVTDVEDEGKVYNVHGIWKNNVIQKYMYVYVYMYIVIVDNDIIVLVFIEWLWMMIIFFSDDGLETQTAQMVFANIKADDVTPAPTPAPPSHQTGRPSILQLAEETEITIHGNDAYG